MATKRREYMIIDGEWVKIKDYLGGTYMDTDMANKIGVVGSGESLMDRWQRVQSERLVLMFKHKVLLHMKSGSTVEFDLPNWYEKDSNQLHEDVASICQEDLKVGDSYYRRDDMKFAQTILVRSAIVYNDDTLDINERISDVEFAKNRHLYDHIIDKYKQYMKVGE